ncbi:MAG: hypothetical protein LBR48_07220 [Dysgonamonadaceae bacterium]|jgi:uncharacterized protein (TIGR02145 family)|nr:hypothetical protein [Dysgonamonadaceae bacterium]
MNTKQSTTKSGNNRLWAALSALCLVLASCSQDETAVLPDTRGTKFVITATIGGDAPQTKATVKYGQTYEIGEDFTWELNDLINVSLEPVSGGDGTKYGLRFKVIAVSENGNTATLEQYDAADYTAPTIAPGEYKLYAAYPSDIRLIEGAEHQAYSNYTMSINSSGEAVWQTASNSVQLPTEVSQSAAAVNLNNANTTNPKAWLYMYDYRTVNLDGSAPVNNIHIDFKHYASLLRYTVTNATASAITLHSIRLNGDNGTYPFASTFSLNAETPSALKVGNINDYVDLTSGLSIASGETVDFYRPFIPAAAYSENSIYKPTNANNINLRFILNVYDPIYMTLNKTQFAETFGADAFKSGYRYAFNVVITDEPSLAVQRMKIYETTDAGVVINGITWATRNVAAPGTFALRPESAGMFYQWNRKVGYSSADPLVSSDGSSWDMSWPDGSVWEPTNDPCPTGWRIPTGLEMNNSLFAYDEGVWTSQNGVNGRVFSDAPNTIFFPAAGYRDNYYSDGSLWFVGSHGIYWCSDQYYDDWGDTLYFNSTEGYWYSDYLDNALSVRCIKDE